MAATCTDANRGTRNGYSSGCRCDACRAAWADYIRARRHKDGVQPVERALVQREIRAGQSAVERAVAQQDHDVVLPTGMSPLGVQILVEAQRATGRRRGELLDELLREHGPALIRPTAA